MTAVCWDAQTAAYYEEEYDFTPPDWVGNPADLLDENGEPPEIVLNDMQIEMMEALFRGVPVISARAGWGSGKTTAIVLLLLASSGLFPGTTSVIVTDSRPRYVRVLHPAIQKWCPNWIWHARDAYWLDPVTGSKFFVVWYYRPSTRTSDANPLEGVDVSGIAIVDECQALPAEVGKKLIGRVRSGETMTRVYVGLPVEPAWWVDEAVKAGCKPYFFSSDVNRKNLAEGWLEHSRDQLSEEEAAAMIDGRPMARVGQVYHRWKWTTWPNGNLVPGWWRYKPSMRGYVAIDPGQKKPSALVIVEDWDPRWEGRKIGKASRPTYIIVREINLRRLMVEEFIDAILEVAWPRSQLSEAPGDRIWLDEGVIDRAGKQVRMSDNLNAKLDFEQAVSFAADGTCIGGLGVRLHAEEDKKKIATVSAGVPRVQRLIHNRGTIRLLCTHEIYADGRRKGADGNSWVRAIGEYRYPDGSDSSKEEPLKTGIEDPLDCIRYFAVWREWYDDPLTTPTVHRKTPAKPARSRPQHSGRARWRPGRKR